MMALQKKYKLAFFLVLMFLGIFPSQHYPVRLTPVMIPPHSFRLSDYATSGEEKLRIQLLMTDLMRPSHEVRLRFSLEGGASQTKLAHSTPFVLGFRNITLQPGVPVSLTNIDVRSLFELQNLLGINATNYARPLPDGMYRFCFQAVDAYNNNILSHKSCASVFFAQYEPPILNLPQRGEKVNKQGEFQNVVFQWMPRQLAPNTKYVFTLKEIWDIGIDPKAGFLSSRVLWQETVHSNTLFYGMDKTPLLEGKRYAWQVQAISGQPNLGGSADPRDNNGVYKNNGLSEIFYFDYVRDCIAPTMLMAKNMGRGRVELRWSYSGTKLQGNLYKVQYRKKNSTMDWVSQNAYQEMTIVSGLDDDTQYEYRIGSGCGNLDSYNPSMHNPNIEDHAYVFSAPQEFRTIEKKGDVGNENFQCGLMPDIDISNKEVLKGVLSPNEIFTAGDFTVTVLRADGNDGRYRGEGYIRVPYLADTKVHVVFDNIQINSDRKLIAGVIETTYDPNESAIHSISGSLAGLFGDGGITQKKVNYIISDIKLVTTPPPGKIIIYGNAGAEKDENGEYTGNDSGAERSQEELALGKDYEIVDAEGNIWHVDEEGKVTKGGQLAEGGKPSTSNTDGISSSGNKNTLTEYTAKDITIEWDGAQSTYAYDDVSKAQKEIKSQYPSVKDVEGKTQYISFKAVVNGREDSFVAKVKIKEDELKERKILFKTLQSGKEIVSDLKESSNNGKSRTYELSLKGLYDYAGEEVLAVLQPKKVKEGEEATEKAQVIGSFNLVHLSAKRVDVSLVPLDASSTSKLNQLEESAKSIYAKIGVKLNIKKEGVYDVSSMVQGNKIATENNSFASTYSQVQQQINRNYGGNRENRYVVFVTEKSSSTGQEGYMRLNGQFGYIFGSKNAKAHLLAHELGHGVFRLEHPWEVYKTKSGSTNLLMDYSSGTALNHLDWKQIGDPKFKLYTFQKQESGEDRGNDGIDLLGNIIEKVEFDTKLGNLIGIVSKDKEYLRTGYELYDVQKKLIAEYPASIEGNRVVYKLENNKSGKTLPNTLIVNTKISGEASIYKVSTCYFNKASIKWIKPEEDNQIKVLNQVVQAAKGVVDWGENIILFDANPSCFSANLLETIKQRENVCNAVIADKELKDLKELLDKKPQREEEIKVVVDKINTSCLEALRGLDYDTHLHYIKKISSQKNLFKANVSDASEAAILRLISAIEFRNYEQFFVDLEKNKNQLLNTLIEQMHDSSVFFWDGNHYTNFIESLGFIQSKLIHENSNYLEKTWSKTDEALLTHSVNLQHKKDASSLDWEESGVFYTTKTTGSYNKSIGKVIISEEYYSQNTSGFREGATPIRNGVEEIVRVSPLTPVFVNIDHPKKMLDVVQMALDGGVQVSDTGYIVPAIFLDYKNDKELEDGIKTGSIVALDVATIATSGPLAFATKASKIRRVWAMMEVAGAVGNVVVNTSDVSLENRAVVDAYNSAMGIIGLVNIGKGGIKYFQSLPSETKIVLSQQRSIRNLFKAKYEDWKQAIQKSKSLSAKEQDVIAQQKKVFKALGFAEDVFKNSKEFSENIIKNRGALRKVLNTDAGKVYARKYFDNIVKEGNFEDWYANTFKKYDLKNEPLNFEVHHVIPVKILEKNKELQDLLFWAEKNGKNFDFNGIDNGIPLQKKRVIHEISGHANHPEYDRIITKKIENILNSGIGDEKKYDAIKILINNTKENLEKEVLLGSKDVNQIINL